MKLAQYWTRETGEAMRPDGEKVRAVARGWSNESLEAARRRARETAQRVAGIIALGERGRQYGYGERPLPEPMLREFRNGAAGPAAVVTRNAYGALVLNAERLMFADIDREEIPPAGGAGLVASILVLFGKSAPAAPVTSVADEIRRVAEGAGLSARLYKTAAGYRALITSAAFQAGAGESEALLQRFGADPLYIRLCRMQECFRARLTPKPWRCRLRTPPVSFPFTDARAESRFQEWEAKYSAQAAQYATCRLLTTFGGRTLPEFEELIRYHDQETRAGTTLRLA